MVADTIVYSVTIKNPDAGDEWTEKCLSKLDRERLVNEVFESVYEYRAKAYNYNSDEVMSARDLKKLEKSDEFSRDRVGRLQFKESWFFDATSQSFTKKIHAVLVAYEALTDEGDLRGYKAAFYIKIK
ncbi:hypothetical protein DMA11_06175 [Marinilabiliaceae bacterium JC017]|nr:hypothetical protein DMA11_06175 [Marinilabiliaceae bacterium JC017]